MLKKVKENLIKSTIASIIGLAIMVIPIGLWLMGRINFMWEGATAIGVGAILFLIPGKIEKITLAVAKSVGGGSSWFSFGGSGGGSSIKPDNPDL